VTNAIVKITNHFCSVNLHISPFTLFVVPVVGMCSLFNNNNNSRDAMAYGGVITQHNIL